MIPAGGFPSDALLFVPDGSGRQVRVFNACNGSLVRDIVGDGGLSDEVRDVLISSSSARSDDRRSYTQHWYGSGIR